MLILLVGLVVQWYNPFADAKSVNGKRLREKTSLSHSDMVARKAKIGGSNPPGPIQTSLASKDE